MATGPLVDAIGALEKDSGYAASFEEVCSDLGADPTLLRKRLGGIAPGVPLKSLLPPETEGDAAEYTWGGRALVTLLVVRKVNGAPTANDLHRGELHVAGGAVEVFEGNLVVEGNVHVEGKLVVLGNLQVRGRFKDEIGAHTVVGGGMRCDQYLKTEAMLSVGGTLSSPVVNLDFNQGFAKVLGGCEAKLLCEMDHGSSRIFGTVRADAIFFDELQCDGLEDYDQEAHVARLKELAVPDIAAEIDQNVEDRNIGNFLIERLEEGHRVFRT